MPPVRKRSAVPVYSGYLKAKDGDELAPGLSVPKTAPPMFIAHGGAESHHREAWVLAQCASRHIRAPRVHALRRRLVRS